MTAAASGTLILCSSYFPCVLQVVGDDLAVVEISKYGQFVCLSEAGCSQISIHSVAFVCRNNSRPVLKIQGSRLEMSDAHFTQCQSDTDGGVVQAYDMAEVWIASGKFSDIISSGFGGAVAADGSSLFISDSWFYNCSALKGGGAIWASAFQNCYGSSESINTELSISRSVFTLCSTGGAGGAVLAVSSPSLVATETLGVSVTSSNFSNCSAVGILPR